MTTIQQRTFMSFFHKGYWMQKKHGKKNFKIDNKKQFINGINVTGKSKEITGERFTFVS